MSRLSLPLSISLFALSFFVFVTDVYAEPRGINLKQELREASIVASAKIVSYDSDSLKFQLSGSIAVLSAKYSTEPTWNPSRFILAEWPPKDEKTKLTAKWPPVGSEVLVVVDRDNVISLFAWFYGNNYRFWSPMMTGSIAIFNCEQLGTPMDVLSEDNPSSWDGCLIEKSKVATKGVTFVNELTKKPFKDAVLGAIVIIFIVIVYFIFRKRQRVKST